VLAIAAVLLARVSARPVPAVMAVRGSSRAIDRKAADAYHRAPSGGSQPSTTSNPLVSAPAPEAAP
jgi:hypothetical protein